MSAEDPGTVAVTGRALLRTDEPQLRAAVGERSERGSSLLFLDFSQLLRIGEQIGRWRGPRFRALAPDLARVRAVARDSTSGEADTTAELFLQIP
jgi:hypothetical protein